MSTAKACALLFIAIAVAASLAACDDAPKGGDGKPSAATTKPRLPKASELPADMVAAVSAGRSAKVIGVHFALGNAPAVGRGLPVQIAIVPHQKFTSVRAHFDSQDGLTLVSGDNLEPISDPAAEKPVKHQLVLMPAREGVFMVTASVETESEEGTITRLFSIPVIVGPVAPQAAKPAPPAPANPPQPSAN